MSLGSPFVATILAVELIDSKDYYYQRVRITTDAGAATVRGYWFGADAPLGGDILENKAAWMARLADALIMNIFTAVYPDEPLAAVWRITHR